MTAKEKTPHPFMLAGGDFPHDTSPDSFAAWRRRNEISEQDYWIKIGADEDLTASYGKPKLTRELTDDQKGWAKDRFEAHFRIKGARWYIRPEKPSIPIPAIKHTPKVKPRRRRHA